MDRNSGWRVLIAGAMLLFASGASAPPRQCPNRPVRAGYHSGIKGRCGPPRPPLCRGTVGPPPDDRPCALAFTLSGAYVACAACRVPDSGFVLPLAAGRYRIQFQSAQPASGVSSEWRVVEVKRDRWTEIYALGAKAGAVTYTPCRPQP